MSAETNPRQVTVGWAVDPAQREELLAQFQPAYPRVVADHVTLRSRVDEHTPLPQTRHGEIIGRVDDERGVEAMIVRVEGTTDRPGGGTYHITWSLGEGRHGRESNDAIAELGWASLPEPIPVMLEPARFPA